MQENLLDINRICRLEPDEAFGFFKTSIDGLEELEAQARLNRYGENRIPQAARVSLLKQFVSQFIHFMALFLWIAGVLAIIAGMPQLAYATWAVIIINGLFSFFQEYRADKALAKLSAMLPNRVKVYRDGKLLIHLAHEITVGDLIRVEAGDRVPADARIIGTSSLFLDNSLLTGESIPLERDEKSFELGNKNATSSPNLIFAGTTVTEGNGMAVVYAVGGQTEIGKVSRLTQVIKRGESTLEIQVQGIVKFITKVCIAMGILAFLMAVYIGDLGPKVGFVFAIGIIVANMPEGLLPTVSLSLAVSVQRMAKQNALVRRLSAVENLCSTTVICTDKTGTITENQLTVKKIWTIDTSAIFEGSGVEKQGRVEINGREDLIEMILTAAVVCSEANIIDDEAHSDRWKIAGPPTEAALLIAAEKLGINVESTRDQFERMATIPFSSEKKRMSVDVRNISSTSFVSGTRLVFTKGAPLEVINQCVQIYLNGQIVDLSDASRRKIIEKNDQLAREGYRILALACEINQEQCADRRMVFLGLAAMLDPPRPEVFKAISQCASAGIKVTIITGDYGLTAASIAKQVGLVMDKHHIINDHQLNTMTELELEKILSSSEPIIFSRATPEHKLRIIEAYKRIGEIVAVTGDGVNDILALKASHVGIAMGIGGTDVAREVSDMILLDNNFATIIKAIEEGRAIYNNIRKFLTYIVTSNVAEFAPFIAMLFIRMPPALNVLQILAIDLGTDIFPAMGLGAEPPEEGTLKQAPKAFRKNLLEKNLFLRAYGFLGIIEGVLAIALFIYVWSRGGYDLSQLGIITASVLNNTAPVETIRLYEYATTMALAAIIASQVGNAFACRSEFSSFNKTIRSKNSLIYIGIGIEILLAMAIIYLPVFQGIFKTQAISFSDLKILILCPIILIGLEEIRKMAVRRLNR